MKLAYNYNSSYFSADDRILRQLRPKENALSTFITSDGIVIGIFQGSRGSNPDLDIRVKILLPGENNQPIQPIHTLWVVDLMLKVKQGFREDVSNFIQSFIEFYNATPAWRSKEERINYKFLLAGKLIEEHQRIDDSETLSIEYVAKIIELFCRTEKLTPNAFWFNSLLIKIRDFALGKSNYIDVLMSAQPGYR
jgi:hypothetical protein